MFLPQLIVLALLLQGAIAGFLSREGNVFSPAKSRKSRSLSSIISLLWPQVVGPMKEGHIVEPSFNEVPETPMEAQMRGIRERSVMEMATRQHIRDLMNRKIALQMMPNPFLEMELHPLIENHLEMLPNYEHPPYLDFL